MTVVKFLSAVLVPAFIVIGGLELAIRLVPAAVPLELLQHFHPDARMRIAQARNLPNQSQVMMVEREDGGPLLRRYKPNTAITKDMGDAGATPVMTTDDLGFCNPPQQRYEREKIDIIVIGDSFTWCSTVTAEEVWPTRLGKMSDRSLYNLGMPGIGLYEYLVMLRKFGLEKSPDIVIMNVYEGNDLRDAWRFRRHRDTAADLDHAPNCDSPLCVWLALHSYVFNLARGTWIEWLSPLIGITATEEPGGIDKDRVNFRYLVERNGLRVLFNESNGDRDEVLHAQLLERGEISPELFDDALAAFVELSIEYDFIPVVVYSPSAYTAYTDAATFQDPSIAKTLTGYSNRLRDYFRQSSQKYEFHFIDLTELLQSNSKILAHERIEDFLYFPNSVHYSPRGHEIVAQEVWNSLQSLPARTPP